MSEIETSEIIWRSYNKFKRGDYNPQNKIKTSFDIRNRDGGENQNKWTNLKILKQNMEKHIVKERPTPHLIEDITKMLQIWCKIETSEFWIHCACATVTITQIDKPLHSFITQKQKVVVENTCYCNYLVGKNKKEIAVNYNFFEIFLILFLFVFPLWFYIYIIFTFKKIATI